jgi:hypothetical protein
VTVEWTDHPGGTNRIASPGQAGAGYRGSVVCFRTSWPGRGAAGMVPSTPAWSSSNALQQLLTGVHHEGAVGGDRLTDRQPPRISTSITSTNLTESF